MPQAVKPKQMGCNQIIQQTLLDIYDDNSSSSPRSIKVSTERSTVPIELPKETQVLTNNLLSNCTAGSPWKFARSTFESIVKLFVTHCEPNHSRPWQMGQQKYTTSSGFVLPGRQILTNAHSVEHQTIVRVKRRNCDVRFIATVVAFSDECDLALLEVEDEQFWIDPTEILPLNLGHLPSLQDSVIVVGYPHGGDGISITAGIVSRVELFEYSTVMSLLSVQIDAAINPGNSGGPALDKQGNVVGVAFKGMSTHLSENIGYIIPIPVVRHFLEDYIRHRKCTGFCSWGFHWLDLESPAMRKFLRLPDIESGILVHSVPPCSPAAKQLKQGDIITHIEGRDISNSGMIHHDESGERMCFQVLLSERFIGDIINLRIFRRDCFTNVTYCLPSVNDLCLVPLHMGIDYKPEYFVYAGLVFVVLTGPYFNSSFGIGAYAEFRTPTHLQWLKEYCEKQRQDEQIVIISHILNAPINMHYEHIFNEQVQKVNGTIVQNLRHLAQLVTECTEEFVKFDLPEDVVIIDRQEAAQEDQGILNMYQVRENCSLSLSSALKPNDVFPTLG